MDTGGRAQAGPQRMGEGASGVFVRVSTPGPTALGRGAAGLRRGGVQIVGGGPVLPGPRRVDSAGVRIRQGELRTHRGLVAPARSGHFCERLRSGEKPGRASNGQRRVGAGLCRGRGQHRTATRSAARTGRRGGPARRDPGPGSLLRGLCQRPQQPILQKHYRRWVGHDPRHPTSHWPLGKDPVVREGQARGRHRGCPAL